jgi:hypothetical protein
LYLKEAGRVSSGLFEAGSHIFTWTLGKVGIRVSGTEEVGNRGGNLSKSPLHDDTARGRADDVPMQ